MTLFPVWLTFGDAVAVAPTVVTGPQWVYQTQGKQQRVYPPRIRGDVWIQPGDLRDPDPALDTWEGEAT